MIRRPPRSTLDRSSAASDVYKRQTYEYMKDIYAGPILGRIEANMSALGWTRVNIEANADVLLSPAAISSTTYFYSYWYDSVSYTHLRAHETVLDLVCRLLLDNKH